MVSESVSHTSMKNDYNTHLLENDVKLTDISARISEGQVLYYELYNETDALIISKIYPIVVSPMKSIP